jgi:hypothetical protein
MPRTAGCKCGIVCMLHGGLVDCSECCPAPGLESRFGFLWGIIKDCPVGRGVRKNELLKGDDRGGDDGWVSLFLKNLPRIFFEPLVGVKLLSVRTAATGAVGDVASTLPDVSDSKDDAGVCTPSEVPGRGIA